MTHLPRELDRRFEAIVFDWDGTAVPDRQADAGRLRALVEELCALGLELAVITGTHVGNVDGQLRARPHGPGRLHLCVNRGSDVFCLEEGGPELLYRRDASPEEDAALDAAAAATVAELGRRGIRTEIVSQRLNRRKIDLIPEPAWIDPPKARIADLLLAVEERLRGAGLAGPAEAVEIGEAAARVAGLGDPRVTRRPAGRRAPRRAAPRHRSARGHALDVARAAPPRRDRLRRSARRGCPPRSRRGLTAGLHRPAATRDRCMG